MQTGTRQIEGDRVTLYTGEIHNVISRIRNNLPSGEVLTITARKNDEVGSIRRYSVPGGNNLWISFEQADLYRYRFMQFLVGAGELARQVNPFSAIKRLEQGLQIKRKRDGREEIRKPFKIDRGYDLNNINNIHRRAIAVALIEFLITNYENISNGTILEAYQAASNIITQVVPSLSLTGVRNGAFKTISESNKYGDLASTVNLTSNESRLVRTIHQTKGAQFNNVLVSFNHIEREKATVQLGYILNPQNFADSEERRITYVALSRAIDRLFISVPSLSEEERALLENMGVEVILVIEESQ